MTIKNLVIKGPRDYFLKTTVQNEVLKEAHHAILVFSNFISSAVKAIQCYYGTKLN